MKIRPLQAERRVYCAGPLFNAAERREMEEIAARLLQAGFESFIPHADGMEFAQVHPYLSERGYDAAEIGQLLHEAIFALDTYQVVLGCGTLVFNANGRVPDEGGVAELTMAWTLGKPVIVFKEDARSAIAGRTNPMIVGQTRFETVDSLAEIADALETALAAHPLDPDWETRCPPHLCEVLHLGEQLWDRLSAMGELRPVDEVADAVLSLFDPRRVDRIHRGTCAQHTSDAVDATVNVQPDGLSAENDRPARNRRVSVKPS